ncbi:retrotransposable element Tf2 [Tanacetum coccineum]
MASTRRRADQFTVLAQNVPHGSSHSVSDNVDGFFKKNHLGHNLCHQKSIFSELNVKLKLSTAYHPQTNGHTESFGITLTFTPPSSLLLMRLCIVKHLNGDSKVKSVDWTLNAREEAIGVLKFHLKRTQDKMKSQVDKHIPDRHFAVGDWVYLKLQPHRQVYVRQGQQHKLSAKHYGPFVIEERIEEIAYTLQLQLPVIAKFIRPTAILERRFEKLHNKPVMYVLTHVTNRHIEEATWEIYVVLMARFPYFDANY